MNCEEDEFLDKGVAGAPVVDTANSIELRRIESVISVPSMARNTIAKVTCDNLEVLSG